MRKCSKCTRLCEESSFKAKRRTMRTCATCRNADRERLRRERAQQERADNRDFQLGKHHDPYIRDSKLSVEDQIIAWDLQARPAIDRFFADITASHENGQNFNFCPDSVLMPGSQQFR